MYKKRVKIKKIIQGLKDGKLLYQAVKDAGVARSYFYRWMDGSPRLKRLVEVAREICDEKRVGAVEDALFKHAMEKGNTLDRIFFLTNKDPDRFKDRRALVNNQIGIKIGNDKKRVDREYAAEDRDSEQRLIEYFRDAAK